MNKHLYHVIMQIVITAPQINNPLRTQGSQFGSCLWLEQVVTAPLAVTHCSCNEKALQDQTLRRKYVGVNNMTQEINHSEGLFSFHCVFINPGCGKSLISDSPAQRTSCE